MIHPALLWGTVPADGVGFKWGSARYVNPSLPATNAKRLRKGAEATKQSISFRAAVDCFAEPVIGRRFAPTRWLAMTTVIARLTP